MQWRDKTARVQLPNTAVGPKTPTDRRYWLIWAQNPATGENKYILGNTAESADILDLLQVAFSRWHIEKWFERAKQETGFGAFEVRTYDGLIRHWLCSRLAMCFLAEQTQRLREFLEKQSEDHAGTSSRRDQYAGPETLADLATLVDSPDPKYPLLPTA